MLHVATHFKFIPGSPDSYLLLGDKSTLTLRQVSTEGLRFNGVELLTLSACDTAVGEGKDRHGNEIEGFGVLAQKQGAHAVLASLWQVSDPSTASLMGRFYEERVRATDTAQTPTKAAALQRTQIAMIRGQLLPSQATPSLNDALDPFSDLVIEWPTNTEAPAATPPLPSRWAHPFYWAPFVILGNWL